MSELEFIRCLKEIDKGKKDGLKVIYEKYGHSVYSYALSIAKCRGAAEDICQEVFIKIWNNRTRYKKSNNHKAWIMVITRNTSIDYLRKYKREDVNEELFVASDSAMADNVHEKIQIDEALSLLNDEEREIVMLHVVSDLTFKSIGEILNKPLGTVTWRYKEAVKKLKERMTL